MKKQSFTHSISDIELVLDLPKASMHFFHLAFNFSHFLKALSSSFLSGIDLKKIHEVKNTVS